MKFKNKNLETLKRNNPIYNNPHISNYLTDYKHDLIAEAKTIK